jgi:hypothetical protein
MQMRQLLEWAKNVDRANPRQFRFECMILAVLDAVIIRGRANGTNRTAADAVTGGAKRELIVMGHSSSEQGGTINCAAWLKGFISKVPICLIAAAEPFWSPSAPPLFSI